jgi:hypothetical protein
MAANDEQTPDACGLVGQRMKNLNQERMKSLLS